MAIKKADAEQAIHIDPIKQGRVTLRMIGTMPLYFNAMSLKVKQTLLLGGGKKTAAQRQELKHDPEREFRDSVYQQAKGETLLCFPASGVKGAMATAALATAGITSTSVKRGVGLPQQVINIWGRPYLKMDVVRSADMNKTPDVRTRAFLPRWCAEVDISYVMPTLSAYSITSLLQNAGVICGIGDFRQEKGKGGYGTFAVSGSKDMGDWQAHWDEITQDAREVQQDAMDYPESADRETEQLMEILTGERARRAA